MDPLAGTGAHTFQLTDAQGQTHDYLVTEHPAGEGVEIFYQLMGLGAPTLTGLLGAALKAEDLLGALFDALTSSDETARQLDTSDLAKLLGDLNLEQVGQEIGRALGTGKAPALTRALLKHTHRDGQPLAKVFDRAYQANYWELMQLIWKVCQVNRFFPDSSTLLDSMPVKVAAAPASTPSPGS